MMASSKEEIECPNELGTRGVQKLARGLRGPGCALRSLFLAGNAACDKGAGHRGVAEALARDDCPLVCMRLGGNGIGTPGALALASALGKGRCRLTSLSLDGNTVYAEGAEAFARALRRPGCRLQHLSLAGNRIFCVASLAAALCEAACCRLRSLNLAKNFIQDAGALVLAEALESRRSPPCPLQSLSLRFCGVRQAGALRLAAALRATACQLQALDLSLNEVDDVDGIIAASGLSAGLKL